MFFVDRDMADKIASTIFFGSTKKYDIFSKYDFLVGQNVRAYLHRVVLEKNSKNAFFVIFAPRMYELCCLKNFYKLFFTVSSPFVST